MTLWFAKSWKELVDILELLVVGLTHVALQLNTPTSKKKCLQFASWNALYTLTFVMIFLIFLGILWGNDKHKYLGRTACGNWRRRGFVQLQRKIRTGRTTFQNYRQILTSKHIALELTVETIWCGRFSCCPFWVDYPAPNIPWQYWNINRWTNYTKNVWIDCRVGAAARWRLVRNNVPNAPKIAFCNGNLWNASKPWSCYVVKNNLKILQVCNSWAAATT